MTGEVAVKFFEKTRLDSATLGEVGSVPCATSDYHIEGLTPMQIWQIGDSENRGFLTPAGFSVVLRLIGHCQAGKSADMKLATQRSYDAFALKELN